MTVAELIVVLQQQPQDAPVNIGYTIHDGDWSEYEQSDVTTVFEDGGTIVISE